MKKIKVLIIIMGLFITPNSYAQVTDAREPVFGYPDAGRVCRVYKHYGFKFRGKFVTLYRKKVYSEADKQRIRSARKAIRSHKKQK